MTPVRTACPYCGVGCGVLATRTGGRAVHVAGDPEHPANHGRLCAKGAALGATVGVASRLLHPHTGGRRVSWAEAIGTVAERFSETVAEHGPDAVAFYVSGQLLTEDYYAANKLMKGFIGSANIDTNSRLCMASAVAAHAAAFGADLVPGCYEDVELAELIVLAGHNAAWTHPVLHRRIEDAAREGRRLVAIDPRRTDTTESSDLHLAIAPQTDVRLWNGLCAHLLDTGAADRDFLHDYVSGLDSLVASLARDDQSVAAVARDCGLDPADVAAFYRWFAETPRSVSLFSQGSNQSAQGVAKGLAILNAHLLTGRIGKPGAAPFSITGQPNAMGGREVGGLATQLAAHMGFTEEERDRVRRFWSAPGIAERPGLKAVDLFEAVESGRVKALWIMATNPAVSLPDSSRVRRALSTCDFVVVSDVAAETDTSAFADVLLPAAAWGEKDGTVTNSERRISRQRPVLPPPGEAWPDWRIVAQVGAAMGWGEAFSWRGPADVFREWAALTAFENEGRRPLDLGGLADLDDAAYDALAPVQWPVPREGPRGGRLFADGRFATPDGRARLVGVRPAPPARPVSAAWPFALTTARVRDQWHTMTRTGLAPELCRHATEPALQIHPDDARALGIAAGALALVESAYGEAVLAAELTASVRRGQLSAPMHWTDAFAPAGRANALMNADRDPVSGQPELKHTPARVRPWGETWRGFAVRRAAMRDWPEGVIWRRAPQPGAELYELAGRGGEDERLAVARTALAAAASGAPARPGNRDDEIALDDASHGVVRRARFEGDRVEAMVCLGPAALPLPPRAWIVERFADRALAPDHRAMLLLGRAPGVADQGRLVCACMGVAARPIEAAITRGAADVHAVGETTGAGTSCGSCRAEIRRMLDLKATARHAA
jgi:assimilatory nitrate reductase catalytic subunit